MRTRYEVTVISWDDIDGKDTINHFTFDIPSDEEYLEMRTIVELVDIEMCDSGIVGYYIEETERRMYND